MSEVAELRRQFEEINASIADAEKCLEEGPPLRDKIERQLKQTISDTLEVPESQLHIGIAVMKQYAPETITHGIVIDDINRKIRRMARKRYKHHGRLEVQKRKLAIEAVTTDPFARLSPDDANFKVVEEAQEYINSLGFKRLMKAHCKTTIGIHGFKKEDGKCVKSTEPYAMQNLIWYFCSLDLDGMMRELGFWSYNIGESHDDFYFKRLWKGPESWSVSHKHRFDGDDFGCIIEDRNCFLAIESDENSLLQSELAVATMMHRAQWDRMRKQEPPSTIKPHPIFVVTVDGNLQVRVIIASIRISKETPKVFLRVQVCETISFDLDEERENWTEAEEQGSWLVDPMTKLMSHLFYALSLVMDGTEDPKEKLRKAKAKKRKRY